MIEKIKGYWDFLLDKVFDSMSFGKLYGPVSFWGFFIMPFIYTFTFLSNAKLKEEQME